MMTHEPVEQPAEPDLLVSKQRASFWKSTCSALSGLFYAWKTERNIRIQIVCGLCVNMACWILQSTRLEWVLIIITCGLVIAAELLNTAIERVVDLVSPEYHPLAKVAKDVAAGTVLLVCLTAIVVGFIILGPPLYQFCSGSLVLSQ